MENLTKKNRSRTLYDVTSPSTHERQHVQSNHYPPVCVYWKIGEITHYIGTRMLIFLKSYSSIELSKCLKWRGLKAVVKRV